MRALLNSSTAKYQQHDDNYELVAVTDAATAPVPVNFCAMARIILCVSVFFEDESIY